MSKIEKKKCSKPFQMLRSILKNGPYYIIEVFISYHMYHMSSVYI